MADSSGKCYTTETVTTAVFSRRLQRTLRFVAKRYIPVPVSAPGVTLVCFHGSGSHKEVWEPTLERVFAASSGADGRGPRVREAWTFDMQSHGASALLNSDVLDRLDFGLPVDEYTSAFKHFVSTGALHGHRLVGIGHSLGVTAVILSAVIDDAPAVRYETLIVIEPALASYECYQENPDDILKDTARATLKRRDTWRSRDHAREYLATRLPWGTWDPRARELYVTHGLKDVVGGVTLCCSKLHESAAYVNYDVCFQAVDALRTGIDPAVPVHWILGTREDFLPQLAHDSVMCVRKIASLQRIPDAGHFVVQENPEGLADAIVQILSGDVGRRANL
ncbi:alpha/beta-hydrolase [Trametes polyzona]|nr:alpha/beta-hydrolase [Trametes polyzona]